MPSHSRSRGSRRGPNGSARFQVLGPVSERQQLALVMQITSKAARKAETTPVKEKKKKKRNPRNGRGETALHVAAIRGDSAKVKKLLEQGHDPNTPDFADNNARANNAGRSRDDSAKKGNASAAECSKRNNMDTLAKGEHYDGKDCFQDKASSFVWFTEGAHGYVSSSVVSSTHDDNCGNSKRPYPDDIQETDPLEDDASKKKRKNEEKELMGKPAAVSRTSTGRVLTGSKPPGPASKTGAAPQKSSAGSKSSSSKGQQAAGKASSSGKGSHASASHKGKSSGGSKGAGSGSKQERESPVASPKQSLSKDAGDGDHDDKSHESSAPKVPPLKIVLSGAGYAIRNEQEGEAETTPVKEKKKKKRNPRNGRGETALHVAAIRGDSAKVKKLLEQGHDPNTPDFADNNARANNAGRSRDDSAKKGNASAAECSKRNNMDTLAKGEHYDGKDCFQDKASSFVWFTEGAHGYVSSSVVSSTQDDNCGNSKRPYPDDIQETDPLEDDASKKKRKNEEKELMGKPAAVSRTSTGRVLTGSKPPGPASKTGAAPQKSPAGSKSSSSKGQQAAGKGSSSGKGGDKGSHASASHKGKSSGGSKGAGSGSKQERKSPVASPKQSLSKDAGDGDHDDKSHESSAPKVPPLKIVLSGAGSAARNEQEGEVHDVEYRTMVRKHPRKRKIKSSRESHREHKKPQHEPSTAHNVANCNPYQMHLQIRKQIDCRQKSLFPVKPKPPKDFNNYLMNRCTYTLQSNVNPEPQVEIPPTLPAQMVSEFKVQEKERGKLRIQHLVEKEKLVLAVEQEILRVHGRAERAVANQALPFSACTMLRDKEVYNLLAPEAEQKRNAQRSRCNGRQINSWLQEVDDKWEKIKEGMLRRQHTEAQTLYAVQSMGWEWKLKEYGLCVKTSPKIDSTHVPQIHVSNFDLPA